MGATAFAFLMLAEAALSLLLFHRSLAGHLALYAQAPHLLGLASPVLFGLFPLVRGIISSLASTHAHPGARA